MTLQPVSGEINATGRVRLAKVLQAEEYFLNDSGQKIKFLFIAGVLVYHFLLLWLQDPRKQFIKCYGQ